MASYLLLPPVAIVSKCKYFRFRWNMTHSFFIKLFFVFGTLCHKLSVRLWYVQKIVFLLIVLDSRRWGVRRIFAILHGLWERRQRLLRGPLAIFLSWCLWFSPLAFEGDSIHLIVFVWLSIYYRIGIKCVRHNHERSLFSLNIAALYPWLITITPIGTRGLWMAIFVWWHIPSILTRYNLPIWQYLRFL